MIMSHLSICLQKCTAQLLVAHLATSTSENAEISADERYLCVGYFAAFTIFRLRYGELGLSRPIHEIDYK